jgi:phosphate transport system protein
MSHFEQRLEADLKAIREWVWTLGEAVENALRDAKRVLVLRDEKLAYDTVLGDHAINRDSRECDRLCHRFIARHLPGAGHLREMASTIRVNVALERMGDYAVTICREALQLEGPLPEDFAADMDAVADESLNILNQSRTAFREGNAELATALMQMARQVQGKMDGIYEALVEADDELDGRTMLAIFVVFSLLKRVADQAKNICDQTLYAVRGVAKLPKIHKVLFLDQPDSGAAQLAVAIGRKDYSEVATFASATPGRSDLLSAELRAFLQERGLPEAELATEPLEALEHDFADYNLLVCLNGSYKDYVPRVPFHTSALNWAVDGMQPERDRTAQYRSLRSQIDDLMQLVAGEYLQAR